MAVEFPASEVKEELAAMIALLFGAKNVKPLASELKMEASVSLLLSTVVFNNPDNDVRFLLSNVVDTFRGYLRIPSMTLMKRLSTDEAFSTVTFILVDNG